MDKVIRGFHHTSFTVGDLERSLGFYRDLLGMAVVYHVAERSTPYLAEITGFPGVRMATALLRPTVDSTDLLELIEYIEPRGTPLEVQTCHPGSAHLCLITDDLRALYERLQTAGVLFRSPPVELNTGPNAGGWSVYSLDPDGITIEFFQPASR